MNTRLLLDTNILIKHWHTCAKDKLANYSLSDAQGWATQLIELRKSKMIATPVAIEFLAGVRNGDELKLAREYLDQFEIADKGKISDEDWRQAKRFAEFVPRDGKPRHLGDCLLKAIAVRLHYGIDSFDARL